MAKDPRDRSRSGQLAGLLMTAEEVAQLYSVHKHTVYRWIKAGRFPHARKVGRSYMIPADEATKDLARPQALQVAKALKSKDSEHKAPSKVSGDGR